MLDSDVVAFDPLEFQGFLLQDHLFGGYVKGLNELVYFLVDFRYYLPEVFTFPYSFLAFVLASDSLKESAHTDKLLYKLT